jgi:hypothetical protein
MAYYPNNPNGQTTSANSAPVVLASDQSAVPISDNGSSLTVDGSVTVSGTVTANAGTGTQNVSVQNASIPVTDNGGSLTVDGSVSVSNFPSTQAVSGTVTVQDGGSSLTVDGSVSVSNFPTVQDVSVTNASIPVTDNGSSLTVDGTITATQSAGATYNIQISDGASTVPIDAAHADGETNTENHIDVGAKGLVFNGASWDRMRGDTAGQYVQGNVAHDTTDSGFPVKIGFQAEASTFGTPVVNGDRVNGIADVFGRQLIGVIDASMQVWKSANYTTQQTGASIWTPSSGKKICITYLSVASYATTGARVIIWFGASGDTTYTAGTDQLAWAGSFVPSVNSRPGAIISLPYGITAVNADHQLRITTDAAISLDITVYGYEC